LAKTHAQLYFADFAEQTRTSNLLTCYPRDHDLYDLSVAKANSQRCRTTPTDAQDIPERKHCNQYTHQASASHLLDLGLASEKTNPSPDRNLALPPNAYD
jgi:hypothetical protein